MFTCSGGGVRRVPAEPVPLGLSEPVRTLTLKTAYMLTPAKTGYKNTSGTHRLERAQQQAGQLIEGVHARAPLSYLVRPG